MFYLSPLRGAAALSAALLAISLAGPVFAQSSKDGLAECQQLHGLWSRYNGTSAYAKNSGADIALEECRKGNTQAGIADLKRALQRANIPLPPSETAAVPR